MDVISVDRPCQPIPIPPLCQEQNCGDSCRSCLVRVWLNGVEQEGERKNWFEGNLQAGHSTSKEGKRSGAAAWEGL